MLASLSLSLLLVSSVTLASNVENCKTRVLCNGVMCKTVCVDGTLVPDSWVSASLKFQRKLQKEERLCRATLAGTHNSAISQAYGFAIEQDFIQDFLGKPQYQGDDLGTGACQTLGVIDQLNLGMRHIEIDITSGYFELLDGKPRLRDIFVCHSPIPLDPKTISEVNKKAKATNTTLGWKENKLSCLGVRMPFRDMLQDIKTWMNQPENLDEVVVLYLDVKPVTVKFPFQVNAASKIMASVFGFENVWLPADGDPLNITMSEFVRRGKRVIFESHAYGWPKDPYNIPHPPPVFIPDLFNPQWGASDFKPYPDCSIGGDNDWYTPVNSSSPHKWPRSLSTPTDPSFTKAAVDCGISILSPNYIAGSDMVGYVWSWSENEPSDTKGCVSINPETGRWSTYACLSKSLPLACRKDDDDLTWVTVPSADSPCLAGYSAIPPTNGRSNKRLHDVVASLGQPVQILVNITDVLQEVLPRHRKYHSSQFPASLGSKGEVRIIKRGHVA